MKFKFIPLLLLLLSLTGCALAPDEYLSVTPNTATGSQPETTDAVLAEDYSGLRRAIMGFIGASQEEGTIRVVNYEGNVEQDLAEVVYEMSKQYPLGAYAVDYMGYDCIYIVNYYEVDIHITFRRTAREIAAIETMATDVGLQLRLQRAIKGLESRIAVRMTGYREPDIAAMVAEYCAARPGTVLEQPRVSVSTYPDSGSNRIVEISLTYSHPAEELKRRVRDLDDSVNAAAEYIRYRETSLEKAELLFTYLLERFTYEPGETTTPVYDALCSGIADPAGLAHGWQLICDRAGLECYTVSGLRDGAPYLWNIIEIDGEYRHLDLARCILEDGLLVLRTDGEMSQYYWNAEAYPACLLLLEETETLQEESTTEEPTAEDPIDGEQKPEEVPMESQNETEAAGTPETIEIETEVSQ